MPTIRTRHSSRVAESWNQLIALVGSINNTYDQAFRHALFNTVGMFFLFIILLIACQVYFILQTFVKPLAWAILTGTILFPFKNYLAQGIKDWILYLKLTSTPLVVGFVVAPFKLMDVGFNFFGAEVLEFVWNHYMKIFWGALAFLGYFLVQLALWNHMEAIVQLSELFGRALTFFSSKAIWFLVFPYIMAVNSLWTPEHRSTLRMLAWPLWVWLGLHLLSLLGSLAAPVLVIVGVVLCLGFSTEMKVVKGKIQRIKSMKSMGHSLDRESPDEITEHPDKISDSFWKVLSSSFYHLVNDSLMGAENHGETHFEEDMKDGSVSPLPVPSALSAAAAMKFFAVTDDSAQGTRYMLYLFWMFILVEVLTHYYVIPFLLVPVAYRFIRVIGQQRGAWVALADYCETVKNRCKGWVMARRDVVAPAALRGLVRLAKQGDRKFLLVLEDCIDETVASLLILMMFIAMAISGIISTMQIQQEAVYIVGLSSDFMNETIVKHPELLHWLPEGAQVHETMQTAMDSMYMYGRDWMIGAMRDAIADANSTRVALIEKDILAIADRVYQFYVPRNHSESAVAHGLLRQTSLWGNRSLQHPFSAILTPDDEQGRWSFSLWPQLHDTWSKATGALDWSNITAYIKNNIDTLTSVMESIWTVCKGNLSIIFSLLTTVLSIAVVYFSALMHFIFCVFVYIAALYYLLSSSKDRYKPLDMIGLISPRISESGHVAEIIEQTISDIFAASFKMAAFYGFYTWVLLTLFGVYVKFIPSVMAALLAVCPLVPPYVMCIPAVCELWFLRGEYVPAIFLCIAACSPSMFVDIAIYGDVKTAHPYMFGLSVAGGLVTMGLEGAVFGPVMLCILLVAVQVYRRILEPTTDGAAVSVPSLVMAQIPAMSSDMLISPITPDVTESRILGQIESKIFNTGLDQRDSMTTYQEKDENSQLASSSEEPRPETLSALKRRERLSSLSGLKHSTPRDSVSFAAQPEFGQSPI